ncbi:MAG: DUF2156 domain-containing protein [Gemmatimonadaceae bacterium]|nr:DUF2156 domain-containing protein [Gemmatimonadaceae bacterium]
MLLSGATPAERSRVAALERILPLGVIEVSSDRQSRRRGAGGAGVGAVLPDAVTLMRAKGIVLRASDTRANLALLGDKALLMDDADRSMLMYGVEGRSWVALGDPIGDVDAGDELAWRFRELADRHGGWTVFYEVGTSRLPLCTSILGYRCSSLARRRWCPWRISVLTATRAKDCAES